MLMMRVTAVSAHGIGQGARATAAFWHQICLLIHARWFC